MEGAVYDEGNFELLFVDLAIGIMVLGAMMFLAKKCEEGDFETWQRVTLILAPVALGLLCGAATHSLLAT